MSFTPVIKTTIGGPEEALQVLIKIKERKENRNKNKRKKGRWKIKPIKMNDK
jgi:hypothetical protein